MLNLNLVMDLSLSYGQYFKNVILKGCYRSVYGRDILRKYQVPEDLGHCSVPLLIVQYLS